MCHRKKLRAAIFLPLLLTVLACPAWAAPPAGKARHYPGKACSECHKGLGKSLGKGAATSAPAGSSTGTGATGAQTGTKPSKGAPKAP